MTQDRNQSDRPAHLEIYYLGKWHVYDGPVADFAWMLIFVVPAVLGLIVGVLIGAGL